MKQKTLEKYEKKSGFKETTKRSLWKVEGIITKKIRLTSKKIFEEAINSEKRCRILRTFAECMKATKRLSFK